MLSRRVVHYIKTLSEYFDISLMCIKNAEQPHIERYEKARILRVPLKRGSFQKRIAQFERALRRQLESEEYAVVHSFDFASGRILADLKKQLGYRLVFEALTLRSQEWPHCQPELALSAKTLENIRQAESHAASHATALIVATQQQKNFLLGQGLCNVPVHVLFHPALPRKGIPPQPTGNFQFLHLGGESQLAALQTILNAFETIPQKSKIQLALGGHYGAESKAHLTALRETLDSKGTVIWPTPEYETETSALCAQADAALLVLEHETRNVNFGGAMPELADFFAWKLPIVASDLPCVREFLGEEEALFFAPGDSAMLAKHMQTLADSLPLQKRLSQALATKADAFGASRFIDETLRIYSPWMKKASQQTAEPPPEMTPSRAKTASFPAVSFPPRETVSPPSEQDTLIVLPDVASLPPE